MSTTYKITNITFSSQSDIVEESQVTKRKTILIAHVSYSFKGIGPNDEYGTVLVDLGTICTATMDSDGNYTSIDSESSDDITLDYIYSKANPLIESKIQSTLIEASERSQIDTYLASVRSIPGLPSEYSTPGIGQ